jgi:ComF family protein
LTSSCRPPVCSVSNVCPPEARIGFCDDCLARRTPVGPACCRRCAHPYPKATSNHLCPACLQNPPKFSAVHAVGRYQGNIRQAVRDLKYQNRLMLAKPLGEWLADTLPNIPAADTPQCIVPVPLHRVRLQSGHFNQAVEIARPLSRHLDIPLFVNLLQRTRKTPSQQGLSTAERRRNVKGVFAQDKPLPAKRVLLVDDIMTTGATVRECCRVFRQGGAVRIDVAIVGRA